MAFINHLDHRQTSNQPQHLPKAIMQALKKSNLKKSTPQGGCRAIAFASPADRVAAMNLLFAEQEPAQAVASSLPVKIEDAKSAKSVKSVQFAPLKAASDWGADDGDELDYSHLPDFQIENTLCQQAKAEAKITTTQSAWSTCASALASSSKTAVRAPALAPAPVVLAVSVVSVVSATPKSAIPIADKCENPTCEAPSTIFNAAKGSRHRCCSFCRFGVIFSCKAEGCTNSVECYPGEDVAGGGHYPKTYCEACYEVKKPKPRKTEFTLHIDAMKIAIMKDDICIARRIAVEVMEETKSSEVTMKSLMEKLSTMQPGTAEFGVCQSHLTCAREFCEHAVNIQAQIEQMFTEAFLGKL